MKKLIWFVLFCSIGMVQPLGAQNKVTEQQKSEYEKGNRDRNFLKGYIEALKADGQTEMLSKVVDEYLMGLPLTERYSGENLTAFMEYVTHMDTRTFVDVIGNWEKLSLSQEQRDKLVENIDYKCKMDLFNAVMAKKEKEEGRIRDYSVVQAAIKKSDIPVSHTRRQILDMWQYWGANDLPGMIQAFGKMIGTPGTAQKNKKEDGPLDLDAMLEGVVIGSMVNDILEKCTLEQCNQILEMMNQVIEKNSRNGFMEMIAKMRDNFEGKKMMMEMGEE